MVRLSLYSSITRVLSKNSTGNLTPFIIISGRAGAIISESFKKAFSKDKGQGFDVAEDILDLVKPGFPPIMAIHGSQDSIAPISDARSLISRVKSVGTEAYLIEVPGADHGLHPQTDYVQQFEQCIAFVERHVQESILE